MDVTKTNFVMKLLNNRLLITIAAFVAAAGVAACEARRPAETGAATAPTAADETTRPAPDTVRVVRRGKSATQELAEFKDWVNRKASRADSAANENWPEARAEFRRKTAHLEQGLDSLSADAKAEYQRARVKFNEWERQNKQRTSQPLQPAEIQKRQAQLLSEYQDLTTITAANAREAYLIFMGTVRAKKRTWTQDDWDYANYVYGQLNDRKAALNATLSAADKLKIRSLQAEYLALEAGQDAKDLINTVKSK